jgi:diguanylate cyclase (GGDEF)-like protein/PAS domain S-box-containing protein
MDMHSHEYLPRDALIARIHELEVCLAADEALRIHQIELETQNRELIAMQKLIEEARDRFGELYDSAPVAFLTLDEEGVIQEINLTGAQMLGLERSWVIGKPLSPWVPAWAVSDFFRHLRHAVSGTDPVIDYLPLQTTSAPPAELRYVRLESVALAPAAAGRTCRTTIVDLSDRKRDEDRLHVIAQVFERSIDAILITDRQNLIVSVNFAFTQTTGYASEEVLGRNPAMLASGRHDRSFYREMWAAIERDGSWSGEIWNRHKNGEVCAEWLTIHGVRNEEGGIENCIGIYTDITDQRVAAERIQFLAHYDPLTRLPNRTLLQDRMQQGLAHAAREDTRVALLFLDLDRFKPINDSLGHLVGDRLLQEVAIRLKGCVREDDTVARRGGDEFIVMLPHVESAEQAAHVAEKIIAAMDESFSINGHVLNVTFSIGISIYPDDAPNADTLVRNADIAMYRSKAGGRNKFQFFTPDMNAHALERLALENDLHRALERDEFTLMYQPQIDSESGEIIAAEALLRWQHPRRGLIGPAQFIPVAEESGLIVPIGEWVLEQACEQMQAWRDAGLKRIGIAVNISALQFSQKNLAGSIRRVLERSGIEPATLELELTESVLMHDHAATCDMMDELNSMGVRLAIDDFGTGYSSLSYLRSFPIHKLKIDQSFVRDLNHSSDAGAITSAIIAMAKNLNLRVIAEGVETPEQASFLQAQACDEFQGNLFGRPLTAAGFAGLLGMR